MRLPLLISAALVASLAPLASAAQAANPCQPWAVKDLATGLGVVENLLPTRNEIYFSQGGIKRFTRTSPPTMFAEAANPGAIRIRDGALWFTTGNGFQAAVLGSTDGTLQRIDLRTKKRTTWASGLTMPNGFTFLPDGSAVTSRDLAVLNPTGITRITPKRVVQTNWSNQADSNGLAVDPTGRYLYSDETFTLESKVYRTEIANPSRRTVVASLGGIGVPKGLDDLTISRTGILYVTANSAGEVIRLDPRTGKHCVVASGLTTISSVRQGAGGAFPANRLYATTFTGRIAEITPPAGVTP
jgi:sugar lactone lactonase YvrE